METIAMKVVDICIESAAGKLERMLEEEAALLAGVEDDVRYIVRELRSITSFLMDMSTRRNLDNRMENWVREVREVAYDAEDSIDEFDCRLRVKGFFKHFLGSIKSLKARHGIALEIKKLKVQIEEVRKSHDRYSYSLPNEVTSSGTAISLDMADDRYSDPRIFSHFVEEAQLVGINQSRDTLIEWVMDETCLELTTISLVGFGGLGKTTLAKTVYDHHKVVKGNFQSRAWIAVSQNHSIRELLKKIIRQISITKRQIRDVLGCQDANSNTEQLLNMMDEQQLVQIVKDHLHGQRYLLVLDDVWTTEAWKNLRLALPPGKEGSRVLVTTRSEEVANTSCSGNRQFIFKVSPLSTELSWKLFCRKVFDAPDYSCPPELENVGREILQKCSGLPLAIVTIGGLLASKLDKKLEEWKDLRDHLHSEIQTNDMLSNINKILGLSYNDLPYHLKRCFLFLGIFPEDYEIRRKRLMRWWIAEGIVSGVGDFPAEKVAERYFNELVSRSLVQPSKFDQIGAVKSCRLHDMMLDVIISISRKENFVVLLNEHATNPPQHYQKVRRLSCHGGSSGLVPDTHLSHLRSFIAFGEDVSLKDYRKQRLLRMIDLEGCPNLHHLHPKSFSELFLLKYLSLRNTELSELPDSIGDLQNLEFLDIRGTSIRKLPKAIVKLQKLVYLFGGTSIYKGGIDGPLLHRADLRNLKLPKGIGMLKKLRSFGSVCADNVPLLQEIGELVDLEKLAVFFGRQDLTIRMLEEINALLSKLNGSLRSLILFHFASRDMIKALNEIARPPLQLCELHMHVQLGGLPPWFASLRQVVKITLFDARLPLQDLEILRNLPTLVKLVLGPNSFSTFDGDLVFYRGGFTHLKFLKIYRHSVSFKEGAVQSLEILKFYASHDRFGIQGIEHLHGLNEVHSRSRVIEEKVKNIAANHPNRPKYFALTDPYGMI